jgi:uncharacterized membrane protein
MAATFETNRLEAFSDGVIAVIITIMVLELKVPVTAGFIGLQHVLPTLGIYALSFSFVATYWVNHHAMVDRIERSSPRVLWANLVWLFCLSLLPFFTEYVVEHHADRFSVAVYGASLTAAGLSYMLLRLTVEKRQKREGNYEAAAQVERAKHWISLSVYMASVVLAWFLPRVALVAMAASTLAWVLPELGIGNAGERQAGPESAS